MAVRLLTASAALSVSAGLWRRSESERLTYGNAYDDLFTTRTLAVTFANPGNTHGLWMMLRRNATTLTGNLTISLQENTGAWVTRTTDVFPMAAAAYPNGMMWLYWPLTPWPVTAVAGIWRFQVSYSVNGQLGWQREAVAGNYTYAACLDASTAAPVAGDTVIVADGQTLTFDVTSSWAAIYLSQNSVFEWENPPAASYTLTLTGNPGVYFLQTGTFRIGTEASPIPAAQYATIDISGTAQQRLCQGIPAYYMAAPLVSESYAWLLNTAAIEMWGEEDANLRQRCHAAAAGQPFVDTYADMSAIWSPGDTVTLFGKNQTGNDAIEYSIVGIVGTTVQLSANLNFALLEGGAMVNRSEYDQLGIRILGNAVQNSYVNNGEWYHDHSQCVGCYWENFWWQTAYVQYLGIAGGTVMRSVLIWQTVAGYGGFYIAQPSKAWNITVSNFHRASLVNGRTLLGEAYNQAGCLNWTVSNITGKGGSSYAQVVVNGTNVALSDMVLGPASAGYYDQRWVHCAGNLYTIADALIMGMHAGLSLALNASTLTRVSSQGAQTATYAGRNLYLAGGVDVTFIDCEFGTERAAPGDEVYVTDDTLNRVTFKNCEIAGSIGNYATLVQTSYLRWQTYNATANDHRDWWRYGLMQSVGDGLVDTTVHTAGAGKFALRFQPESGTNRLEWSHTAPTGNISGQTMTVAVWCKINAAAYWAGTFQMPRLTVDYDDGTLAYAEAAASTSWQLLSVVFTPTTAFGQIGITLSGMTDAVGANAYVYWDDGLMLYPAGYVLNIGGMDLWANGLPVTPLIATVFSAIDVWTAQTSVMTGAGTIGKHLVDNVDAPISSRASASDWTAVLAAQIAAALDATISSRAPAATALSNVNWTGVRAALLDHLNDDITSRADAAIWTAALATLIATNLDATVGSRAIAGDAMALTPAERTVLNTLFGASSLTLAQAVKVLLGANAGKTSGMETGNPIFRDIEDTMDVVTGTLDADGNRTSSVVTP